MSPISRGLAVMWAGYGLSIVRMRASLMRLRGADPLGPELDAVLLEHPRS